MAVFIHMTILVGESVRPKYVIKRMEQRQRHYYFIIIIIIMEVKN
jgi:hypothetical protein